MTLPPSRPFHITGLRLVCQVKPQNWAGKFAAAGDDKLSRIWYLGAYTVKVNLLADQFGSILIYRGSHSAHLFVRLFLNSLLQATGSVGPATRMLPKQPPWPPSATSTLSVRICFSPRTTVTGSRVTVCTSFYRFSIILSRLTTMRPRRSCRLTLCPSSNARACALFLPSL